MWTYVEIASRIARPPMRKWIKRVYREHVLRSDDWRVH